MNAGIFPGLQMAEYLALQAASATDLDTILAECPRAAWFGSWMNPSAPHKDSTKAMDKGTICHSILNEGDYSKVAVIDPADYPGAKGAIPKGWTTIAIKEARDAARGAGQTPVLKDDFADIEAMVASALEFIEGSEISDIWPATERETTLLWHEGDVWLRSRPDALSKDRLVVVDVKTTAGSANPEAWGRTQVEGHNELQAALGVRGLRALVPGLRADPRYVWLVVSQEAPFLCSLVAPDPAAMALAGEKADEAIELWRRCAAANRWPGYPSRICWISPPPWQVSRWEERPSMAARTGLKAGGKMFSQEDLAGGIPL